MKNLQSMTFSDVLALLKGLSKKTWIIIGISSGVGLVFFIFICIPAWITRFEIRGKIENVKSQIYNLENLSKKKPELMKRKDEHIAFIQQAKEHLFKSEEMAMLLGTISKIANETKVSIVSSSPKEQMDKLPPPFDAQYEAGQYDFMIEGGYHDIAAMVSHIESHPKLLRIQQFTLRSITEKGKESQPMAELTVSAVASKETKK